MSALVNADLQGERSRLSRRFLAIISMTQEVTANPSPGKTSQLRQFRPPMAKSSAAKRMMRAFSISPIQGTPRSARSRCARSLVPTLRRRTPLLGQAITIESSHENDEHVAAHIDHATNVSFPVGIAACTRIFSDKNLAVE
jgi:hypothetical protein